VDQDPDWRRRPRPAGCFKSTVRIPGNLLTEGTHFVEALAATLEPPVLQFSEREAVAFEVIDSLEGDSARGDWTGNLRGAMRPLLPWETEYSPYPNGQSAPLSAIRQPGA
jgi:lipopolysaccharide transport system ATP-binding protein